MLRARQAVAMTPENALRALGWIVDPPETPSRPGQPDWDVFARRNGFEAPADHRLLLERYGVAGFGTEAPAGGWLVLLDPFEPAASLVDLSDWDPDRETATRVHREGHGLEAHTLYQVEEGG
jgi:hypothetical protein